MQHPISRRVMLGGLATLPAAPVVAQEPAWPSRPIRLIYPFATGGGDFLARAIAEQLRLTLGQSVVVDNRPGANTMLAAEAAARAPKDGHTLGWVATSTLALSPHFYPNITYRLEDFEPVCLVYRAPLAFAVSASLPIRTVAEAAAHIRANPGIGCGSSGNGGTPHLAMEVFNAKAGLQLLNIAYRGEQAIVVDLMAGRLPFYAGSVYSLLPHVESGQFRILALTSPERLPALPAVPTFRESGFPEVVVRYWHGIVAPAGVPQPILERLADAVSAAIRSDFVRDRATPDLQLDPLRLEAFRDLIRQDQAFFGAIIRERNISL